MKYILESKENFDYKFFKELSIITVTPDESNVYRKSNTMNMRDPSGVECFSKYSASSNQPEIP